MNKLLFIAGLFIALLCTMTYAAYDIESAQVAASSAVIFKSGRTYFATANNGDDVLFGFTAATAFTFTKAHYARVKLPPHYTPSALKGSITGCQLEIEGSSTLIIGTPQLITAYGESSVDLYCRFPDSTSVKLTIDVNYYIRFKGCGLKDNTPISRECSAGLLPPATCPLGFPSLFAKFILSLSLAGNWSTSSSCCRLAYFAFFDATKCLDSFSDFDGVCNVKPTGSCLGGCAEDKTKLINLGITASSYIAVSTVNVSASFKFAARFDTAANTIPSTHTNGGTVPPYVRITLSGYSAVFVDGNPYSTGITCGLILNGAGYTPVDKVDVDTNSPATVVRQNGADLYVYCALKKTGFIEAGSSLSISIKGVISPQTNTNCAQSNSLSSTSSYCCGSHSVAVVQGNFINGQAVYTSLPCNSCPVYYPTSVDVQNANSSELCRDLTFYPSTISSVSSSDPTVPATTGVINNGYYRFQTTSIGLKKSTRFTLALPGFRLSVSSSVSVKVKFISNVDASSAIDVTADVLVVSGGLRLSGLCPFDLEVGVYYTIFFPEIIATDQLPSSSQCQSQALTSSSTSDAFCCSSFYIEFVIGNSKVFIYASTCPILPGGGSTSPLVCNNPNKFDRRCCHEFMGEKECHFDRCVELFCSPKSNPFIWIPGLCCNANAASRSSERCCRESYFCPQFCCGGEIPHLLPTNAPNPIPVAQYPFVPDQCCAKFPGSDIYAFTSVENIDKKCQCYYDFSTTDYTPERVQQCCLPTGNPPTVIAPRHPICECVTLYDLLAVVTKGSGTEAEKAAASNKILIEFMASHIGFDPKSCCEIGALATAWSTPEKPKTDGPPLVISDERLTGWLDTDICKCISEGNIVGGTFDGLPCCEYDYFAPNCPIACPNPPGSCGCGSGCGSGVGGCSCCKNERVNISSIKSGEDVNISVNSNPRNSEL